MKSKWLQPSLHKTLRDLAAQKVREICVVPIAFVSDHVETLGEIDHEAREEALRLGFRQFEMSAGLNDSPRFISALGQLVIDTLNSDHLNETIQVNGRQEAAPELLAAAAD